MNIETCVLIKEYVKIRSVETKDAAKKRQAIKSICIEDIGLANFFSRVNDEENRQKTSRQGLS